MAQFKKHLCSFFFVMIAIAGPGIWGAAQAKPLTIAIGGAFTTMDPHFYNATPNHTIAMHIFDRLIDRKPDNSIAPALATSWKHLSDTEWVFTLRQGVKWHDGVPFTAEDVAFTYKRAPNVPNSPGGFGNFLREIASVEVIDPLTLKITTKKPAPNLLRNLAFVPVISKHIGETATTEDYNSGKTVIGTGAFKFTGYFPGDRVTYVRNDDWWGGKTDWETLTVRMITEPGARVAALLSGDADIIDTPPANDLERLASKKGINIFSVEGMRMIFYVPNLSDTAMAGITAKDGSKLAKNPLIDVRVRKALSLAINRQAIADRIMQGAAEPTGQWLAKGSYSYADSVQVPPYDPKAGKALLSEAGYPDGFNLTLCSPNNRYPNDGATTQALAQMWTRIGVKTSVETLPWSAYIKRFKQHEFSVGLLGWGSPTGEAGYLLSNVIATPNPAEGLGIFNHGGYSNPELDKLLGKALVTIDDNEREKMLIKAVEMTARDIPIIPLHLLKNNWAVRKCIEMTPRRDERTLAMNAHLTKACAD